MTLATEIYLAANTDAQVEAEMQAEWGWKEVSRALYGILLAHLLMIGAVVVAAGVIACMVLEMADASPAEKAGGPSMVLYLVVGLAGLVLLSSYGLILKNLWRCLMHAPERNHAKWLMFASILCILMGPALSTCAGFFGAGQPAEAAADEPRAVPSRFAGARGYAKVLSVRRTDGCLRVAGSTVGLLSSIFFGLFLRATALCFEHHVRARLAEGYVLLQVILAGVSFTLIQDPVQLLAHPEMLLGLVAGGLVVFLWYLVLVASVAVGISSAVTTRRSSPAEEPLAQPLAG
jgi:hypothetical protein